MGRAQRQLLRPQDASGGKGGELAEEKTSRDSTHEVKWLEFNPRTLITWIFSMFLVAASRVWTRTVKVQPGRDGKRVSFREERPTWAPGAEFKLGLISTFWAGRKHWHPSQSQLGMVGGPTWRVVVQNGIAHADLQNEGAQQLLHVVQQGIGAGKKRDRDRKTGHVFPHGVSYRNFDLCFGRVSG